MQMKNVAVSFLVLAALYVISTQASCAILDEDWNLFDVSSAYFNTSDDYGTISSNLCLDMEKSCSHTTNEPCSICQYISDQTEFAHSYCLGYSRDEVYTTLNASYTGQKGFRAIMKGDSDYCPYNVNRITNIDVFCSQRSDQFIYEGEYPTCTYNFRLNLKQNCVISPASFTPTFHITSVTPTSISLSIDDSYPWMFWTYNVKLNGVDVYSGESRHVVIENLSPGTQYSIVVSQNSGYGAVTQIVSPSSTLSVTTFIGVTSTPGEAGEADDQPITVTTSGQGMGILIGLVIAAAIAAAMFGGYKLYQRVQGGNRGGFTLRDAERSNAFE